MATTTTTIADPLGTKLIIDSSANAEAEDDVTTTQTGTIYACEIDNTKNGVAVYVKLTEVQNATSGTNGAAWQFMAPASTKITYMIPEGVSYNTYLSFWCVVSPFTTSSESADSATSPGSDVEVKLLVT
jgi:hypothetical protein|tara:strand:- start:3739 stop:4125 length:387 start_codon:yes stop_codon:yes gene_type:complete